jgi:hypothetical protein
VDGGTGHAFLRLTGITAGAPGHVRSRQDLFVNRRLLSLPRWDRLWKGGGGLPDSSTSECPERSDHQRNGNQKERNTDEIGVDLLPTEGEIGISFASFLPLVKDEEQPVQTNQRGNDEAKEAHYDFHAWRVYVATARGRFPSRHGKRQRKGSALIVEQGR